MRRRFLILLVPLLVGCSPPSPARPTATRPAPTATMQATAAPTATARATIAAPPAATAKPTEAPAPPAQPATAPTATAAPAPASSAGAAAIPTADTKGSYPCQPGQIKGNLNKSSSGDYIYHVPGGQFYERTYANVRCFNTEQEAVAAGFRRSER